MEPANNQRGTSIETESKFTRAAEYLEQSGPAASMIACELLGLQPTKGYDCEHYNRLNNLEGLMAKVMVENSDGTQTRLLHAISKAFIQVMEDAIADNAAGRLWVRTHGRETRIQMVYGSWSHALCHNFEKYGRRGRSILQCSDNLAVAEELISYAVKTAGKVECIGCADRMLGGLIAFNLDHLHTPDLGKQWTLFPEALRDSLFVQLVKALEPKYYRTLQHFLGTATPTEFLVAAAQAHLDSEGRLGLFSLRISWTKASELLLALKPALPRETVDAHIAYLRDKCGTLSEEMLAENLALAREHTQCRSGLFVDVDGTLIVEGKLHDGVLEAMERARLAGKEVVIFSGGDPAAQTARLRARGVKECFLPVRSKSDYRGCLLDLLLDDTEPAIQGFQAYKHFTHWSAGEVFASMAADR